MADEAAISEALDPAEGEVPTEDADNRTAERDGAIAAFMDHRAGVAGAIVLAGLVLMAILAPLLAPYDPIEQLAGARLLQPSPEHVLGTDEFGRDVLSRLIHGSRISLGVGIGAVAMGASIGVLVGLVAGYREGWFDALTMRASDVLLAWPGILLAIVIVAVLGPGITRVGIAVGVVNIPIFARLTRSMVLRERELDYVQGAIALGASDTRILFRHILPNSLGPVLAQLSISMGVAVLLEAALSFLGLGTQPPAPSWGSMLDQSRQFLRSSPLYGVAPGFMLALLILSLNMVGDALRDVLDPHAGR